MPGPVVGTITSLEGLRDHLKWAISKKSIGEGVSVNSCSCCSRAQPDSSEAYVTLVVRVPAEYSRRN